MFAQRHLSRYAEVLIWALQKSRSRNLKKNSAILVHFGQPAAPLAEVLFERLLQGGFNPIPRMALTPAMERCLYERGTRRQLTFIAPGTTEQAQSLHGSIYIHAPESLLHLQHAEPDNIARAAVARKPIRDILNHREEQGAYSWTLALYPTEALAEQAGMSTTEYRDQIVKACYLNRRDPVVQWQEVYQRASGLKRKLNRLAVAKFHVVSARCDLFITPGAQRRWIGLSGHNIPSFELFLSPDWRGTEGVYFADQPSYRNGQRIENVRLVFRKGRVVEASADRGEAYLRKQLAMDTGAAQVGEFSLTDRRFSKIDRFMATTLYDENFGGKLGNCHIAVGASYSDAYAGNPRSLNAAMKKKLGFNNSALHWDLVNTEPKTVTAHMEDGQKRVIYKHGRFQI